MVALHSGRVGVGATVGAAVAVGVGGVGLAAAVGLGLAVGLAVAVGLGLVAGLTATVVSAGGPAGAGAAGPQALAAMSTAGKSARQVM